MSIQITVSSSKDVKKVADAVKNIYSKHIGRIERKSYFVLKDVADRVAKSWRARVSTGKYNYRSSKPGPHSRTGGLPLEKAIMVKKLSQRSFGIAVLNISGRANERSKPSKYANYYKGRHGLYNGLKPYSYKVEAIRYGAFLLKLLLRKRWKYGRCIFWWRHKDLC